MSIISYKETRIVAADAVIQCWANTRDAGLMTRLANEVNTISIHSSGTTWYAFIGIILIVVLCNITL